MTDQASQSEATSYRSQVRFTKPPESVFDALTTLEGLARWWSPATGSVAAPGELRLTHRHEDPLVLRVDTVERPDSVEWSVLDYPLNPEWVGTRITFMLRRGDGGGTELQFCHHGLTPQLECYEHCSRGWDHFLPSLRDYVETGVGRPLG